MDIDYLMKEDITDNIVIIKINKSYRENMSALELYDVTRGCWKRTIKSVESVNYALAVAFGIVKEVYEIDNWVSAENVTRETIPYVYHEHVGRIMFNGSVANKEIRDKYIGKNVSILFKRGEANPVKVFLKKKTG